MNNNQAAGLFKTQTIWAREDNVNFFPGTLGRPHESDR
jgi:hypothetical protein